MKRMLAIAAAVLCAAGVAVAQPRRSPPSRRVALGPIEVEMFGTGEPQRGPYGAGGERTWLTHGSVTQTILRGPPARLTELAPGVRSVRDADAIACGGPARRRQRVVPFEEITSVVTDEEQEAHRYPGPAEITLAFERAGEQWALVWHVSDRRERGRHRALERRFFRSLRCAS